MLRCNPADLFKQRNIEMRYLSPLLFILLIVGCRELPVEDTNDVEVALTVEQGEYRSNQRVTFSLKNNTSDPILAYESCLQVDQRKNGEWEFLAYLNEICHSTNNRVPVGHGSTWEGVLLDGELAEGDYRLALEVLLQEDWRQRERVVSNSFKIKN